MLTKEELLDVFKFKLVQLHSSYLLRLFFLQKPLKSNNMFLFLPNDLLTTIDINEKCLVSNMYFDITCLKQQQFRSSVFLSKFVAAKHTFRDFRFTPSRQVDFRIAANPSEFGSSHLFDHIKRSANLVVSKFNYATFIRPPTFLTYRYERTPSYIKSLDITIRRALFKRMSLSFYQLLLLRSIPTTLIKILSELLYLPKHSLPMQLPQTLWDSSLPSISSSIPNLLSILELFVELVTAAGRLYEIFLDTGLIALAATAGRGKRREKISGVLPVHHFGHHYPFNFMDKNYREKRLYYDQFYPISTNILWLPKHFLRQTDSQQLNIQYILNNFFRPSVYLNKSLLALRLQPHSSRFTKLHAVYSHDLYTNFFHQIKFNSD